MAGLNGGKKLSGEALSPGSRPRFLEVLPKISPAWQEQNHTRAAIRSRVRPPQKMFFSVATRLWRVQKYPKLVSNGPQGRGYIIQASPIIEDHLRSRFVHLE